jgi:transposase-like protein
MSTYDDYVECPACGSPDNTVLGILGTRQHFRCRDCGMDYSRKIVDPRVSDNVRRQAGVCRSWYGGECGDNAADCV